MCSVFTVVQFRSYVELVSVTNVRTIMSAGKCKLCNVCLWGHWVTYLVEALSYKLGSHGFEYAWCHWKFSLT